jgi:hypothetical protein
MEGLDRLEKHWRWWLLLFWLAVAGLLIFNRWGGIQGFALSDTDDNMRIMQVRALLAGQDWYDLRQHRLNPPHGADIHWSRLVDLPIAGLRLLMAPFLGGPGAERWAVALAPLLPMLVAIYALAATIRRMVAPAAFALGIGILFCAHSSMGMWAPLRIDHHGWQLAMLALGMMGLADAKRAQGGVVLGASTALSFAIGLEMLLYFALMGGIAVLLWVRDEAQARRLAAYGATLAGGCSLAFLIFASNANRAPVCDALSPVWLSVTVAGGAVALLLAWLSPASWQARLGIAAAGGAAVAGFYAMAWPNCLGRLEQSSPELHQLWLDNVREARPVYRHGLQTAVSIAALPIAGLIGYGLMLWRNRSDPAALAAWAALAAPALLAAALLLWQSRAGPASQLLAVPGATALAWLLIPHFRTSRLMLVRVLATVVAFALISGILPQQIVRFWPQKETRFGRTVNAANGRCPTMAALRPIAMQPRGQVLTFVDLGPRLIALTHHDAVAGPYHRNQQDIIDVQKAFRGSAENARATIERRGIDYVLICPNLSESTIYQAEAKQGFYMQLMRGHVPAWLEAVELPRGSPYRMWRVRR